MIPGWLSEPLPCASAKCIKFCGFGRVGDRFAPATFPSLSFESIFQLSLQEELIQHWQRLYCPIVPHWSRSYRLFSSSRFVCCCRHWGWWPAQAVHPADEFRERLGARLPTTEHQRDALLDRDPFTPSSAAAGRSSAHDAHSWPATSRLSWKTKKRKQNTRLYF